MIERYIKTALEQGLSDLADGSTEADDIFRYFAFTDTEKTGISTFLTDNPVSVIHQYPRETSNFPLIAITLRSEALAEQFLGGQGWDVSDEDAEDWGNSSLAGAELQTAIFEHSYDLLVCAKHPDVTLYLYHLTKIFMMRAHKFFIDRGMANMTYSGSDMSPDSNYAPEFIYIRRLRFSCLREQPVVAPAPGRGFTVVGLHISGGVTVSGDGGAATRLVTVEPE